MTQKIQSVQIYESEINYHKGENIRPGFAVIVDPPCITEHQKWQVAQKIQDALDSLVLEDK